MLKALQQCFLAGEHASSQCSFYKYLSNNFRKFLQWLQSEEINRLVLQNIFINAKGGIIAVDSFFFAQISSFPPPHAVCNRPLASGAAWGVSEATAVGGKKGLLY